MERHWNYKEEEGAQNPNYLKNSMKGVGEGKIKKNYRGDGLDIFWNNTMGCYDYCCSLLVLS